MYVIVTLSKLPQMSKVLREVTDELRRMFDSARSIVVLTGAGVSAESGVPTFRGGGGSEMWSWRGRPITELSSAELLATDPALVWEWFDYRRGLLKELTPTPVILPSRNGNAGLRALHSSRRTSTTFTALQAQ